VGFIVTTLTGTNRAVVRFYNKRGTAEQWIKEGKEATPVPYSEWAKWLVGGRAAHSAA